MNIAVYNESHKPNMTAESNSMKVKVNDRQSAEGKAALEIGLEQLTVMIKVYNGGSYKSSFYKVMVVNAMDYPLRYLTSLCRLWI